MLDLSLRTLACQPASLPARQPGAFWMLPDAQGRAQDAPRRAQGAQDAPRTRPGRAQDAPRTPLDASEPKTPLDAQVHGKRPQN